MEVEVFAWSNLSALGVVGELWRWEIGEWAEGSE